MNYNTIEFKTNCEACATGWRLVGGTTQLETPRVLLCPNDGSPQTAGGRLVISYDTPQVS